MEIATVPLEIPDGANIIVGQTHFIKTVEDVYEAIVTAVPQMKFGIAFNEASGPCLTRVDGNDEALKAVATRNATAIGAGHTFVVVLTDGYPINVLGRIKDVPEVCGIYLRDGQRGAGAGGGDGAGARGAGRDRRVAAEGSGDGGGRGEAPSVPADDRVQAVGWTDTDTDTHTSGSGLYS